MRPIEQYTNRGLPVSSATGEAASAPESPMEIRIADKAEKESQKKTEGKEDQE